MQDTFFNINQPLVIGGCSLVVVIITSIIHHRVGKITKWWNPKWGSFLLSLVIGVIVQFQFIEVLEPIHIIVIAGNIGLIYLSAVGLNAVVGKPVEVLGELSEAEIKGMKKEQASIIITTEETWRTRWFE
ncbi:MAG: hypothetical protein GTO45_18190 [Candidatus Aminicenantes bacterium]|nr:hypothetical protein [Candidatus Aminicenantes bacterium]NIM80718.1 hypothetical protein [Candidatus Aminicenantes bacterium]NIN20093.1 hypothetical protein [Candidatus Aminicenantes bacterium]NIN43880.1 hypothetical protein [Candidatus Aminicenantes bacterium]NIN86689.1 hypothetical protein [Candidatus Aminicenantes bacterium]